MSGTDNNFWHCKYKSWVNHLKHTAYQLRTIPQYTSFPSGIVVVNAAMLVSITL